MQVETGLPGCQPRYQQSRLRVTARFVARDPDSGRVEYLLGRAAALDLTQLAGRAVRSTDSRVAAVVSSTVHGASPGRTSIQVLYSAIVYCPAPVHL